MQASFQDPEMDMMWDDGPENKTQQLWLYSNYVNSLILKPNIFVLLSKDKIALLSAYPKG